MPPQNGQIPPHNGQMPPQNGQNGHITPMNDKIPTQNTFSNSQAPMSNYYQQPIENTYNNENQIQADLQPAVNEAQLISFD